MLHQQYCTLITAAVCGILTTAAATANIDYIYDDGGANANVGPPSSFPSDPDMMWGNYFFAEDGGELITTISYALGSTFPKGREVSVALFDDPDGDLDPSNATLLATATTIPEFIGGSQFNVIEIEPSLVTNGFFVAVFTLAEAGIDRPAAQDTGGPVGFSWLIYNPIEKGVNLENLGENAFIENMENIGGAFPGVWMIRAVGKPAPPACPADLDQSGEVNVLDLLALLSNWGPCADCPADLTGDEIINVLDLLALLGAWGDCD